MFQTKCPFMVMTINVNVVSQEKNIKLHQNVKNVYSNNIDLSVYVHKIFFMIECLKFKFISNVLPTRNCSEKNCLLIHFLGKCTVFYCALCTLLRLLLLLEIKAQTRHQNRIPLFFHPFIATY